MTLTCGFAGDVRDLAGVPLGEEPQVAVELDLLLRHRAADEVPVGVDGGQHADADVLGKFGDLGDVGTAEVMWGGVLSLWLLDDDEGPTAGQVSVESGRTIHQSVDGRPPVEDWPGWRPGTPLSMQRPLGGVPTARDGVGGHLSVLGVDLPMSMCRRHASATTTARPRLRRTAPAIARCSWCWSAVPRPPATSENSGSITDMRSSATTTAGAAGRRGSTTPSRSASTRKRPANDRRRVGRAQARPVELLAESHGPAAATGRNRSSASRMPNFVTITSVGGRTGTAGRVLRRSSAWPAIVDRDIVQPASRSTIAPR